MKPTITLFLLFFGLISCTENHAQTDSNSTKTILGNWKTEPYNDGWRDASLLFTFQDSTCTLLTPWSESHSYKTNLDTITIIKKQEDEKLGPIHYQFIVDSLSNSYLCLKPIGKETMNLFYRFKDNNFDKIELTKIQEHYDWNIKRIGFYSSICYGTCPSMYLEIDSSGNIYFQGLMYTNKEGNYKGKLRQTQLDSLKSMLNTINLDSVDKKYIAGWTDDQTCAIKIKTADKIYQTSVYGFDSEPIEVRLLIEKLKGLYKEVIMSKNRRNTNDFEFEYYPYVGFPPLPVNETDK